MSEASTASAKHPLHSLCGYLGSFPPRLPRRLLERWHSRRRTILDPFCGGGTSLIEAIRAGHRAIGIDQNPLAIAIAMAKIQQVEVYDVYRRLSELARDFSPNQDIASVPDDVHQIFHEKTLNQLLYLRSRLDAKRPEDLFIRGAILGILHGKFRKDGSSAYLSIDMPNTFSMAPNYVRSFVKKHGLSKPPADAFGKIRNRVDWLLREGALHPKHPPIVLRGDATQAHKILNEAGISTVGGVLTSPPYLGVLRYGAFNWIRLWFLGEEAEHVDRLLDATDSLDRYLSFMASFLHSVSRVMRQGSLAVLVIGDVDENGHDLALAERVWEEICDVVPFDLESLSVDEFDTDSKTTRIWGEERKGRATKRDRVLVLRRS